VLRLIQNTKGTHKLSSPLEGPFIISRVLGNGAYYLIDGQEPRKNKADNSDKEAELLWNVITQDLSFVKAKACISNAYL
jgi:hypothetical protein